MARNLGEIAELLNSHSTRTDIDLLLNELIAREYNRPEFQSYDDLEGTNKLAKILSILSVMKTYGEDKVILVCEIMEGIRPGDQALHQGLHRLCQTKPRSRYPIGSLGKPLIILFVASAVFLGLLFGIVAALRFAVGGNIAPRDLIVLAPVAVVLALALYPFILVLLNVITPKMAQQQFNQLHDFVGSVFPSLLTWLNQFSRFFGRQHSQEATGSSRSRGRE